MAAEYPIEMPNISNIIEVALLHPDQPCSMIRFGVQCGNLADHALLCPSRHGTYCLIAQCDMCIDELQP